jgi:hypothetical protein
VRRTNFKKLVTTELVINMMNALTEENESEAVHPLVSDIITQQPAAETDRGKIRGQAQLRSRKKTRTKTQQESKVKTPSKAKRKT